MSLKTSTLKPETANLGITSRQRGFAKLPLGMSFYTCTSNYETFPLEVTSRGFSKSSPLKATSKDNFRKVTLEVTFIVFFKTEPPNISLLAMSLKSENFFGNSRSKSESLHLYTDI